jgi:hypothetical protein
MRDQKSELDFKESLAPASRTATVNGTGIDLANADGATAIMQAGAAGGTTPSFTFKVQESDDDSTYADVAAADLVGSQPAAVTAAQAPVRVGYIGKKRYLRWAITAVSGTSPTLLCSAGVLLGHIRKQPV